MSNLFEELRRRNVFRVAIVYAIAAWLILQVADIIIPALGIPDWGIRFIMVLLGLGFPIAVIFAWAFEMTPEGLKKEKDVDRSQSITSHTGRKIDFIIIGMLVLAVGYFAVDKFLLRDGDSGQVADNTELSIAVLPFVNMSADAEQEYFSDGISEELLNLLAKVPDFQVAGRTSSFAFKGQNEDLRIIADKLGVENILEGSVRREGNRVRVTAQLVKADSGFHLWSETYDRELSSIFALQDELATAVVKALKTTLLGESAEIIEIASTAANSAEAYDLYLKGRFQWHIRTPESLAKAVEHFQQAIELDPNYAKAYTGLSDAYMFSTEYSDMDLTEAAGKSEQLIEKAFELEPDLPEAWASLGILNSNTFDSEAARDALLKAVELNPNDAMAHMWLANEYNTLGDPVKSLELYERAREIDPLHSVILSNISNTLSIVGRQDDAMEVARELAELYPERGTGQYRAAVIAGRSGRLDEAVRWYLEAWKVAPERITSIGGLPWSYLMMGEDEIAEQWFDYAASINPSTAEGGTAWLMTVRDQIPELVEYTEALLEENDFWIYHAFAGNANLMAGNMPAAREHFDRALRDGEEVRVTPNNAGWMPNYAMVLGETGDPETARLILEQALDIFRAQEARGVLWTGGPIQGDYARIYAQQGDREAAVAALRRAAAVGGGLGVIFWSNDPALEPIRDDLGYINLIKEGEAELARQREALEKDGLIGGPADLKGRDSYL
jgi:TolB-like protein/Flp pilus assembly protein TadD